MNKAYLFLLLFFLKASNLTAQRPEFRGVWIATVANIDWPDINEKESSAQKASFIRLLDMHKRNGMNAVIVQVRPATDAFYCSTLEPWSQWCTGNQGAPPAPYYDPLAFMVEEAHKRGLEFHAWMNPYRAVFNIHDTKLSATHITRLHPDWFITYGDKKYFDPANVEARKYVAAIVKDVVKRYDVDAVHFDDYFYPYKIKGLEFPDNLAYAINGRGMSKDAWRRSNVDSIITLINQTIKKTKPDCQFGISPFGVWRNQNQDPENGSATLAGVTNYDDLYADILLWLKQGWIDYVAPQLYWEINNKRAPFDKLVEWWNDHSYGKNCYIGIGIYRAGSNTAWRNKNELPDQIKKIRSMPNVQGMAFYSSRIFEKNPLGWADSLRLNYFSTPAPAPNLKKQPTPGR